MPPGETAPRPVILILIGSLWPGNDSSGPNQSIRALARALAAHYDIRLVARDRPFGGATALAAKGRWSDLVFAKIAYLQARAFGASGLIGLVREIDPDLIWLNGFFDREFTIAALTARRMGRLGTAPVVLSPRGEFGDGALSLKSARKRAYLAFARAAGLLRGVTVHATSVAERSAIAAALPWHDSFAVAGNLATLPDAPQRSETAGGPLRLVFVGRISRVKNLDYALRVLGQVKSPVTLEICGPAQDAGYWAECRDIIAGLPDTIRVSHRGEIANAEVPARMAEADILFLPTMGENFGHAIFEALSCGVPVLISDATPWRDLQAKAAGWDLPLAEPARFAAAIETAAAWDAAEKQRFRNGARACAEAYVAAGHAAEDTLAMVERLLASRVA